MTYNTALITPSSEVTPALNTTLNTLFEACDDAKAGEIVVLDVRHLIGITDYFIICSGRSDRHVQGIAQRALAAVEQAGIQPRIEGLETGHWTLVDCGEIVVHIFYEPERSHYDLEGLWASAPKVKLGADSTRPAQLELVRGGA